MATLSEAPTAVGKCAAVAGELAACWLAPDIDWHFAAEPLASQSASGAATWLEGVAQQVKTGNRRRIFRVAAPDGPVYLKHCQSGRFLQKLVDHIRGNAASREYHMAVNLARRGVPVVPVVAYGERRRGGLVSDAYLVTRAVEPSHTLADYLETLFQALPVESQHKTRAQLARLLAQLCARMHAAGVMHDDLHAGNLLVRTDRLAEHPAWPREILLVDLADIRLGGNLNFPAIQTNLVMLAAGLSRDTTPRDRLRFWLAYRKAWLGAPLPETAALADQFVPAIEARRQRVAAGRDDRPLRNNRQFRVARACGNKAYSVVDVEPQFVEQLLADPAGPLAMYADQPAKIGHASLVVEAFLPLGDRTVRVAYKRSRTQSWVKRLLNWLRRPKAVESWRRGHALLARGIRTARPLLAVQLGGWPGTRDSYLATQWIEDARDLHLYGWQLAAADPQRRRCRARQAAESLGRLVGQLHAWQIAHRDLKGCNLVLTERDDGVDAWLIDLDGLHLTQRLPQETRVRNLARVALSAEAHPWLSRTDRLRFLRSYLAECSTRETDWKTLWRAIARRTCALAAEYRRLRKPIA